MKRMLAAMGAALGVLAGWGAASAQPATIVPPTCERQCLIGFVDRYLDALVAHDPSRLPLVKDVKYTENGAQLQLGDGLWGTVQARRRATAATPASRPG